MFNKRPDGRAIKNLEPMQMIMPYVMKTRTDSMNMYEDTFACEPMDAYIKEKAANSFKRYPRYAVTPHIIGNAYNGKGNYQSKNSVFIKFPQ